MSYEGHSFAVLSWPKGRPFLSVGPPVCRFEDGTPLGRWFLPFELFGVQENQEGTTTTCLKPSTLPLERACLLPLHLKTAAHIVESKLPALQYAA